MHTMTEFGACCRHIGAAPMYKETKIHQIDCTGQCTFKTCILTVPMLISGSAFIISFGLSPRAAESPMPSCPSMFAPQHFALPLSRIAHTCMPTPHDTRVVVLPC